MNVRQPCASLSSCQYATYERRESTNARKEIERKDTNTQTAARMPYLRIHLSLAAQVLDIDIPVDTANYYYR